MVVINTTQQAIGASNPGDVVLKLLVGDRVSERIDVSNLVGEFVL